MLKKYSSKKLMLTVTSFLMMALFFSPQAIAKKNAQKAAKQLQKFSTKLEKKMSSNKGTMVMKINTYAVANSAKRKGLEKLLAFSGFQNVGIRVKGPKGKSSFRGFKQDWGYFTKDPGAYRLTEFMLLNYYSTSNKRITAYRGAPVNVPVKLPAGKIFYLGELNIEMRDHQDFQIRYSFSQREYQALKNASSFFC